MRRYFFDIHDGNEPHIGAIGTICQDDHAARNTETRTLIEMAADFIPGDGPQRDMLINVRDHDGEPLLELSLKFRRRST